MGTGHAILKARRPAPQVIGGPVPAKGMDQEHRPEPRYQCTSPECTSLTAPAWPRKCHVHRSRLRLRMLCAISALWKVLGEQRDLFGNPIRYPLAQNMLWRLQDMAWVKTNVTRLVHCQLTDTRAPAEDLHCKKYCWQRGIVERKLETYTLDTMLRLYIPYVGLALDAAGDPAPQWTGSTAATWCNCGQPN